jgi:hypothetical protein|mmetsp:Transcript_42592/g.67378  ORF Transcript_42592/g.67378 Transcript_42592/m.67378 type:complete len:99 (-) Transcript_42592:1771-2067(-)
MVRGERKPLRATGADAGRLDCLTDGPVEEKLGVCGANGGALEGAPAKELVELLRAEIGSGTNDGGIGANPPAGTYLNSLEAEQGLRLRYGPSVYERPR